MERLPKIVQQRLQATANAGVHPDPDLLAAFAEKSLNERERAQLLQHLGQCTDCREVVSLAMPEIAALSPIPARSPWLTWPVLRWSALAACAVVVSAAVALHYERRQDLADVVAQKAAAPSSPANSKTETQVSSQAAPEVAEKIAPPAPVESGRDFGVAGKLANQREDTRARPPARASAMNGLANGGRANNSPGTEGKGNNELTANRLTKADALQSTDKPSAPRMGRVVGAVAAPAPAGKSKAADSEAQTEERKENLDYAAKDSNETVTVEAESNTIETAQATVGRAKDESDKKLRRTTRKEPKEVPPASRNIQNLSALSKTMPRWTLSPDGALERSFDSGKTWQIVPVASHAVFRTLAANDSDVWVGGTAGVLFHSSDAGEHWTQVKPVADGKPLTTDIISVEFTDIQHGKLITDRRETWTTGDGGASWHRY
ncbi:MAG TPA: YCF48-related protein [Terriglobales bacterium]|nr:YCF48-related protein [Terriglobales bacterium]